MRAAIIGYGSIGRVHARVIPEFGELVAVCDVDEKVLETAPGEVHYTDYKKMLDEVKPDVVHVCTPHYLHADMVIEALSRDINVLCEKPLCIKEEDIGRILEAEKKSKAKLGVCLQNRYNNANRYIKDYLSDKVVEGGVGSVSWHRDAAYYRSGPWRGKWDTEGGGVLINQALHTLDLMQWFCGMPERLTATVSNLSLKGEIEVEDSAVILAKGEKGGFTFFASNGANRDYPVEITLRVGSEWVKIMPQYVVIGTEETVFGSTQKSYGKECYGSGHQALIADFYDCIRNDRPFEIDGTEGAKVVRIILAVYRSQGNMVELLNTDTTEG